MISGKVQADEAIIRLKVRGRQDREQEIEAVVDTGYSGFLTLPQSLSAGLGLRWKSSDRGILADGSVCLFDVYIGTVVWNRKPRRIYVDEADAQPLVGMALLHEHELKVQVRENGKVEIKRLRG